MGNSGAESDKTKDLEPEEDSSYSAQVFPSTSDRALRKRTHGKSDGSKDPFPQEGNSKEGEGG